MADDVTLSQAIDFTNSTLQHIEARKPAKTFLYENYVFFNTFWKNRARFQGGKEVEGHIILGDEGNARHSGLWAEDTTNVVNITKKYTIDLVHATTNFSYNVIEVDLNNGPERIYNFLEEKRDNMIREWVDAMLVAAWGVPSSSSDVLLPWGIPGWLVQGTDNSTGGWTGYNPRYSDGTAVSGGIGGLASSATSNARWANYYADHQGNLDDSLLVLLDRATRKLNFIGPAIPQALDTDAPGNFSLYSNDNVIGTLNQLYAKSDDQMGNRISVHYGIPYFKNMPFQYVPILDTANTSTYNTDPIFGIKHTMIYPVVHSTWNFKISEPRSRDDQHLVLSVYGDIEYCIFGKNRRHAGFRIDEQ